MTSIAILGQGAMGTRMARRLIAAGLTVTTWNRTGATASPRQTVAGADIVIAMVRDDDASRAVWLDPDSGALAGMKRDSLAIDSSTLSPGWARDLGAALAAAGLRFLDAPVVGSRPQAEAGALIHLIGGDASDIARAQPVLAVIGGAQHHAGPVGSGAALKLIVNTLFGVQVAAMAEVLALVHAMGLDAARSVEIMGTIPVMSPAAKGAAALMLAGDDSPMFPIELVAKDFGYAEAAGGTTPVIAAAAQVFRAAVSEGLGDRHISGVARRYHR